MKRKGSLSVEAIISFTVFLGVSFLLLTLVKLVLIMIILNNATAETTKTIAAAAYPIAIANDAQEGLEEKIVKTVPAKLAASVEGTGINTIAASLLGGSGNSAAGGNIAATVESYISGLGENLLKNVFFSLKGQGVNWLCGKIVSGYVENCGLAIDKERLVLRAAKIPETEAEFTALHSGNWALSEKPGGLSASPSSTPAGKDGDFCADDIFLCLEYPYEINVPLVPNITVTLRSVSVERGWLNAGATGPKRTEGIDINDLLFGNSSNIVYVATGGNGKCYHKKSDCNTLWTSQSPMSAAAAKNAGFRPCKLCYPEEKK